MKRFLLGAATFAILLMGFLNVRAYASNSPLPSVGQTAPEFTLPSQDGSQIALSSFRGKWVVLYFYPKDMTSGCTLEAHNFERDLAQFHAHHAVILGVSVDSPDSHRKFCTKEGLTFRLLADAKHSVVASYGSMGNFLGFSIADRNTFLIAPDGKIARVWTKVRPSHHSEEVLKALDELTKGK